MTGLTDADRVTLATHLLDLDDKTPDWDGLIVTGRLKWRLKAEALVPAVEAIVARRVAEALTEAADAIERQQIAGNDLLDTEIGWNDAHVVVADWLRARIPI